MPIPSDQKFAICLCSVVRFFAKDFNSSAAVLNSALPIAGGGSGLTASTLGMHQGFTDPNNGVIPTGLTGSSKLSHAHPNLALAANLMESEMGFGVCAFFMPSFEALFV